VDEAGADCNGGANCACGTNPDCKASGESCDNDGQCCNGLCDQPNGAPGICYELGACNVAGEPCSPEGVSGGSCCSAACLDPTGSGNPKCQYLGGCRIQDELCKSDSECCSGLCEEVGVTQDGRIVKRCGNNGSCLPIGEVCFQGASANCCPNGGGSFGCKPTSTGIDRCYGGEGNCTLPGDPCETTDECCKDPYPDINCEVPANGDQTVCCLDDGHDCAFGDVCCCGVCAPDTNGALVCCPGGQSCVPSGGSCTADSDCCQGCCDDSTGTCTTSTSICGTCTGAMLGELCTDTNACCNNVNMGGPVDCVLGGEFFTCQLQ